MCRVRKVVLAAIVIVVPLTVSSAISQSQNGGLAFSIESHRDTYYSLEEPVWLKLKFTNKTNHNTTFLVNWTDPNHGVTLNIAPGFEKIAKVWSRPENTDYSMVPTTLRPGEAYEVNVLLNELLSVEASGQLQMICQIEVVDLDSKPMVFRAHASLTFTGAMSPQHLQELLKELDANLDSKSTETRYEAARSLGVIPSDRTLDLLRKALSDNQESVQMAAVMSLAYQGTPGANALLKETASGNNKMLSTRAQSVLDGTGRPKKN